MKTLHLSIITILFALALILTQTAFATILYNNNDVLKQFDTNSTRITKLVQDGAILITTQTIKKIEYKLGEKITVHPELTNIGNKSTSIWYMLHPFFFVINNQNGSAVWANGPSVPEMEYSSNRNQTLKPNVHFTGGIDDITDPRYPAILDVPGNYTISSVADFYGYGTPRNLVWSEPIKFTVLPEKYSVADMNMLPPLQQFLAGIPATSVICRDGLDLLIKTNTGLPICVKHNTATKLVERGWATKAPSQIPVIILPPGFDNPRSGKTFEPSLIKVVIGINNTVRWINKAGTSDTLMSDGFKESNSFGEIFAGSTLRPYDTYEFTFTKAGTYGYHGGQNSWQKGTIVVLSNIPTYTNQGNGSLVILSEGQREGPLLVQKILPDNIEGLNFREFPLATNIGYPINLHIGDSTSNGCTVVLTLVKINGSTATFLKKEYQNKPCPICLSENTVIDTPNGSVNVKELKEGMTILTQDSFGHKGNATILKTGRTLVPPDHKMVHVVLNDKRELYVSPNHPTADGRLFGELLVGDTLDGSKIKNREQVSYNGTYTYDILPSGKTGLYWANGILVKSTLK